MSSGDCCEPEFGIGRLHLKKLSKMAFNAETLKLLIHLSRCISNCIWTLKPRALTLAVRSLPTWKPNFNAREELFFESLPSARRPQTRVDDNMPESIAVRSFGEGHPMSNVK